jgi:hypothetical protein
VPDDDAARVDLLDRAYRERQLIVVVDDAVLEAERQAEVDARAAGTSIDWRKVAGTAASTLLAANVVTTAVALTVEAAKAAQRARQSGLEILTVGQRDAAPLQLPPGHPRNRVVYAGSPVVPAVYYPAASFHRLTFEHKFAEAIRLLMALGATELEVEHVVGWSDAFAVDIAALVPTSSGIPVAGGVNVARQRTTGQSALFHARLAGTTEPRLPDDLVWYPHEPTWQEVAKGRLDYGLQEFQLVVRYDDSYGIDAGLKVGAQQVGLDLGGAFQEHETTIWRIRGTFGAPGAAPDQLPE